MFNLNLLSSSTHAYAFHIDTTTLADGTYGLVPEAKEGPGEAQVNFADAIENPNPTPEASETNLAQKGKLRSITPNLSIQYLFNYLYIYVFRSCMEP